jgi:purine nucleosidase
MWDMLATSYLAIPEEFTVETVRAYVNERPPNAGQTIIGEMGHEISIATNVNKEAFYTYILKQFRRD